MPEKASQTEPPMGVGEYQTPISKLCADAGNVQSIERRNITAEHDEYLDFMTLPFGFDAKLNVIFRSFGESFDGFSEEARTRGFPSPSFGGFGFIVSTTNYSRNGQGVQLGKYLE